MFKSALSITKGSKLLGTLFATRVRATRRNASSFQNSQELLGLPGALNFDAQNKITKFIFFTGKGGVGKTSISCSTALALASNLKKKVLLISTDPASNLDEIFSVDLSKTIFKPSLIPQVPKLYAVNLDPNNAAEMYRRRVLDPYEKAGSDLVPQIREQLSGACTTEVATFDEFAELLANDDIKSDYDHIIFDTAPTGHTLRLLKLPMAWSSFLDSNQRGASCLGPHSGLTMHQNKFHKALDALTDTKQCTTVIVSRPELSALKEAERTHQELNQLLLRNQQLVINGVFKATDRSDKVAMAMESLAEQSLTDIPQSLRGLPQLRIPLKPMNFVGIEALKELLANTSLRSNDSLDVEQLKKQALGNEDFSLDSFVSAILSSNQKSGLIMVMGKGGVGKTTIASAIAIKLAKAAQTRVHLTTTDPAAHLSIVLQQQKDLPNNLSISRIDPRQETQNYIEKVIGMKGDKLDEEGKAFLKEDLQSPCTEEVAVFHAFSRVVSEAKNSFVVMDTAPTGHTLLLLDATGSYHRDVLRSFAGNSDFHGRITTPLLRLRDSQYTKVVIVTHAENTPVTEAQMLQDDLNRAGISPYGWIVNKSLLLTNTTDPVLTKRMENEVKQLDRVRTSCKGLLAIVPWLTNDPLQELTGSDNSQSSK